jgi:hypothetical protein
MEMIRMDARLTVETYFDSADIEKFKSVLARYIATRITKEILSQAFEQNTEQGLTEYQQVIQHNIYTALCKKYKSKTVMKSLKELDAITTRTFNEFIKNYAEKIWRDLESLINLISLNGEYKEICYSVFFECLNANTGGEGDDKSGKSVKLLEKTGKEGREERREKEGGE